MKNISKLLLAAVLAPSAGFAQMSLEDRVAELEANQSLNIFSFSGALETSYDSIKAKQGVTSTTREYDEETNYLRMKAFINVDAKVSPKINFYSRFATSKFFNTYEQRNIGTGSSPELLGELSESRDEKGSQVYLEKAYADYTFAEGSVFSFGRLPTIDGPLTHIQNGRPRSGTYPALMYNSALDGLALSKNMALGAGNFAARVIYTPFMNTTTSEGKSSSFPAVFIKPTVNSDKQSNFTDLTSLMLEYGMNTGMGAFNVIYQGYQTGEFYADGASISTVVSASATATGSGVVYFKNQAHNLTAEWNRVANTDLDLGVSYITTRVQNRGSISMLVGTTPVAAIYGLGASKQDEVLTGSSSLVSARYSVMNELMVGAEYLAGGKNVFIYDVGADNLTSFYSTPGTGTHAYVLFKPEPQLGFKLGYMNQEYKNTPFTFGESKETDRKVTTYYANIRLDF